MSGSNDGELLMRDFIDNTDVEILNQNESNEEDDGDEVETDDEEDSDIKDITVVNFMSSRPCTMCIYLALILVALGSTICLAVAGVLIVAPFHRVRHFFETTCYVSNFSYEHDFLRCSCGKGCVSLYPCLKVYAYFPELSNNKSTLLYENEENLKLKCTFYPPCKSSKLENTRDVHAYKIRYGTINTQVSCLVNPIDSTEVIRTKRFKAIHVFHGLFWPLLLLMFCVGAFYIVIQRRGCHIL